MYAERHAILLDALGALPVEPVPSAAGLHVAAWYDGDALAAEARARRRSVVFETIGRHAVGRHRDGFVLGYGAAVTGSIQPGIEKLAALLEG